MTAAGWLAVGAAGLGAWWLTAPRPRFAFRSETPAAAAARPAARPAARSRAGRLLWLAGIPLPPWLLGPARVAAGVAAGLLTLAVGQALPAAVLVGLLAAQGPPGLLRLWAQARWREADQDAYALANTLRYVLPVAGHPVAALRELTPTLGEPLRGWMAAVLAAEAAGGSAETALADLAARLGHTELGLLADILRADRHEKPTGDLLEELLDAWTDRMRADEQRRAKLAGGRRLVNLLVGGPLIVFVLLPALAPAAGAVFTATAAGQAVGAVGLALLGAGAWLARVTLGREEAVG